MCLEERDGLRPCFLPAAGKLPKTGTWESYLCDWCSGTLLPSIKGSTNTLTCPQASPCRENRSVFVPAVGCGCSLVRPRLGCWDLCHTFPVPA